MPHCNLAAFAAGHRRFLTQASNRLKLSGLLYRCSTNLLCVLNLGSAECFQVACMLSSVRNDIRAGLLTGTFSHKLMCPLQDLFAKVSQLLCSLS